MIRNYLLTAFRALYKQKFYTFINALGLSVGIAACLIILLFVSYEFSFDRQYTNADRIYRLHTEIKFGTNHMKIAAGYPVMAELFPQNFPEIENVVRITNWGPRYVRKSSTEEKHEEKVVWADSSFFKVFSIPVLEGDAARALREPNTIAISQKIAEKYFAKGQALGQSLLIDGNNSYMVTAIYEDMPSASHFHFDILRSMAGLEDSKSVTMIGGSEAHVYLLLKEGVRPEQLEAKFPLFIDKYVMPQIGDAIGGSHSLETFRAAGNIWEYSLMNIKDIHLHSSLLSEFEANGNIQYVYLFSAIALFILVIACINFMNLATARSVNRAREVGVRKVMGSQRWQLINQFLAESLMLTAISFGFAVLIAYFFLPVFNTLASRQLFLPFASWSFYLLLVGAIAVVALLAGLYPAFFLSGFSPVKVLKGKLALGTKNNLIRSGLVVFQFVVSIFLIIATITVNRQLNYIQSKRLGFDKDQVIVVNEAFLLGKNLQAFKNEALENTAIQSGTISGYLPVSGSWRSNDTYWKGDGSPVQLALESMVNIQEWEVDVDYLTTFHMNIKKGRGFSREFTADSASIILNETAVERFKFEGDPIGQRVSNFGAQRADGSPDPDKIKTLTVIGVVENFHFESLKSNIGPLGLLLGSSNGRMAFRFQGSDAGSVIATLEKTWKKLAPDSPFQYSFLDDDFGRMYTSEQRLGKIFVIFSGLAIIIACLGLFALTAFTSEQRRKEIGIRKALGASIQSIVILLSRDLGRLIAIAFLLAIPAAWYSVGIWLNEYAYRTSVGVTVYLLAGIITVVIAGLTMSFQSIKAARTNPVETLRSE